MKDKCTPPELRDIAARSANVVLVDFANRALPDLSDMDSVHRNVASGQLADLLTQIAGGRADPDR